MTFQYMQREFPLSTFKGGEIQLEWARAVLSKSYAQSATGNFPRTLMYVVFMKNIQLGVWINGEIDITSSYGRRDYKHLVSEMYLRS